MASTPKPVRKEIKKIASTKRKERKEKVPERGIREAMKKDIKSYAKKRKVPKNIKNAMKSEY